MAARALGRPGSFIQMAALTYFMGFFFTQIEGAGSSFPMTGYASKSFGVHLVRQGDITIAGFDNDGFRCGSNGFSSGSSLYFHGFSGGISLFLRGLFLLATSNGHEGYQQTDKQCNSFHLISPLGGGLIFA
ncbi:MAG: hypothetical protein A2X84_09405 [Desulfuromonadaceae bacterium GWC2_58_13]|nr:MAG: hypothetical protein A2X84_09405 [Desulfuromonadaceae bacterium GWC2_58_13]